MRVEILFLWVLMTASAGAQDLAPKPTPNATPEQRAKLNDNWAACGDGKSWGCTNLGLMWEEGEGLDVDLTRARLLYERSCDLGSGVGCKNVGVMYANGEGVTQDTGRAAELYRKGCDLGDLGGCINLGVLLDHGDGVEQDDAGAGKLYRQACDGGNSIGCNNLAFQYAQGEGVDADMALARSFWRKSCDGGYEHACDQLRVAHAEELRSEMAIKPVPSDANSDRQSQDILQMWVACQAGDTAGCTNRGLMYSQGQGVPQDKRRAASLYRRSCDLGSMTGCKNLGVLYAQGLGVDEDIHMAAALYAQSCDGGKATGCDALAWMYVTGKGVPVDESKAVVLYQKACAGGYQPACDQVPSTALSVAAVPSGSSNPAVSPVADLRFNFLVDEIQAVLDEGGAPQTRFEVPRAAVGMRAKLSERVKTRVLFNVLQENTTHEVNVGDDTDAGVVLVPATSDGWALRLRDLYADLQPWADDRFWVRAGVQAPIFSVRDRFNRPDGQYYTIGPQYTEVALLAGLIPGRDLGVRATGEFAEGRGQIDAMVSNGTGTKAAEDNRAKDLSGRFGYSLTDKIRTVGSAQYGRRGPDGETADTMYSLVIECRGDRFRAMGEYLSGTLDAGEGDAPRFVGGMGAAAWERPATSALLNKTAVVGRVGYFDPSAATTDADAWMLLNGSVQGWWKSTRGTGFMTGLGYESYVPMNATLPIEHRAVLQTLWKM